ncbi:DNA breaking-rejoining enzyme [Phanerochaete sordida]|uniref:DNA breaking-rejoining enzyme n=1 Tax=Phanerochaete sordida TaxID=48140 RepID=A0A9P3LC97_9APHY|nr:DNA breaking-rejoining enzyme [Phanerochaete sordida]
MLSTLASAHSLRDAASYGAGIRKFHIFCDIFSVPEADRLPASFALLNSFALWAAADPIRTDLSAYEDIHFEAIAPATVRKYLSAVSAWHIAQGWPTPLSAADHARINWHLRGLERLQGSRRRPPRPPITLQMLAALRADLDLSDPFNACVWAIAACAFWGLMRFGELTVKSRAAFDPGKHLTRGDADYAFDLDGKPFFRLNLREAKTAQPGEVQQVYLTEQGVLCPHRALRNLAAVVPAGADDPLFSWRDRRGCVRPMVRDRALQRINTILGRRGWGTTFGHSFRIGGASFMLGQGVSPEVVRILGRWRSLAYEAYIRAFEQVSSRHVAHLSERYGL